ncbi:sugar ABC transporter permease [Cryobacterium sp. MDB2-33-2]|uniref:carbohydrate ABC transporter permease n=1 Tax=Cryobacterium sp. MDB2-33-2 TaxID=1259179 RepID=UPI00106AB90E|nr:sugar ABC transporter permease [Cryobacterium sp. MDB2-33-2]TFC07144.1 sugar ABC transporter permease [Cryobacterium sp. MDB2-33-2]
MTAPTVTHAGAKAIAAPAPARRRRHTLKRRRSVAGLIAVSPALALILMFFVAPMVLMFWMSLNNWPLLGAVQKFIGGANYAEAVTDGTFWNSVLFTLKYTLIITPIELFLGYALALIVRRRFRGVAFFRAAYFAPVVVGFASGAYIFLLLIQPESGLFDQILQELGITSAPLPWLTDSNFALFTVVLMITWKTLGTSIILLMVGMQSVPEEIREASLMDGASWFKREWFITLPLMRSSVALVLMLNLTGSFLAFDQFFVMTHGGPNQSTVTIVMWIYTNAFVRYRLGYSAALSILLLVLLVIFTVAQIRALRDRSEES